MKLLQKLLLAAGVTAASLFSPLATAHGESTEAHTTGNDGKNDGLQGSIALGGGSSPAYEGSKDRKIRPTASLNLFYGDTWFLTGTKAGANLLQHKPDHGVAITAGPLLSLNHGRSQSDHAALNGLGSIAQSLDAGGFVRFRKNEWRASVEALKTVTNADQGATVNLSAAHVMRVTEKLGLRTTVDTTWASSDYMKTYFGINALQATRSRLPQYAANSGFKHAAIGLATDYSFNREWAGYASLRYKRLLGDAAKSPIVATLGDSGQVTATVGIAYRF